VEYLVVALRTLYGWNETRLAHELRQRGLAHCSHTTVGHIFRRYHLPTRTYCSKARADGLPYSSYEKSWPNAQWHIDFAQITLADGEVVRLAVVIDDYSRFCLDCAVIDTTSTETVRMLFLALCRRYAVRPQEVVTDNDRAFVSVYVNVPTRFALELQAHNTRHRHTSLYYPEGNGKAEAFIKTLKSEALNRTFTTSDEVRTALTEFQDYYNFYRLHSSLGYLPPAVRYWGIESPQNHGLSGLPALPPDLLMAYPPHPSFQPYDTNPDQRRQALALVPVTC
jgi:transposase InsO family protein